MPEDMPGRVGAVILRSIVINGSKEAALWRSRSVPKVEGFDTGRLMWVSSRTNRGA